MIADVDILATTLARMGAAARAMPPSWASDGDRFDACGPGGERIGDIYPGEGLALGVDLASLGITRPIPNVFERSAVLRLGDRVRRLATRLLGDERGAIATYDGIIAGRAGGLDDDVMFFKNSYASASLAWSSSFRGAGMPTVGTYTAIPTGASLNRTNVGALNLGMIDPTGGNSKYLLSLGWTSAANVNMCLLVDLLVGCGSISANVATAQTVSSAALTRYTTGVGVQATFEITTALGATPANISFSYTNQAGTSGQTSSSQAMSPSGIVQRLQPSLQVPLVPLGSGDTGIRAVASVTLSAAMGSGVIALNLYKPLVMVPGVAASVFIAPDLATQIDGLKQLTVDGGGVLGCLALFVLPNSTTTGDTGGFLKTVAG